MNDAPPLEKGMNINTIFILFYLFILGALDYLSRIYGFNPFMTLWHYFVCLTNESSKPTSTSFPSLFDPHGYEKAH
jgi:hypothetical protein